MKTLTLWFSASGAAEFLDVSTDTVLRRAAPWSATALPGKVRFKLLKLGENTRQERRYYRPDLEAMLVTA